MIDIPAALVTEQVKINGTAGQEFIAGLPDLAREFLDRWELRAWTLGRVLQDCLWEIEDGRPPEAERLEIARLLRGR